MTDVTTIEVEARDRFLFEEALETWRDAVKGIANRAQGMGYELPAAREDLRCMCGRNRTENAEEIVGLLDRVKEQASLFEENPEALDELALSQREMRCLWFALRNERSRIQDLETRNRNAGYSTQEQAADLDRIGEDGRDGRGWLKTLDRGWMVPPADDGQEVLL